MAISRWNPPHLYQADCNGKLVHGSGVFKVRVENSVTYFERPEIIKVLLGVISRLAWPTIKPFVWLGLRASLQRLRRLFRPDGLKIFEQLFFQI